MLQRQTEPQIRGTTENHRPRKGDVLIILTLLCVMSVLLVSTLPMVLVSPALSKLLALASLAAAAVAILCRDQAHARGLTHWDQAAALLGLSILTGLFTDVAAVSAFLDTL